MRTQIQLGLLVLMMALTAGCVTVKDRYEKAEKLGAEGRYAASARKYVEVLQREPDYRDARSDLRAVGKQAVQQFLEDARRAEQNGDYEHAALQLHDLGELRAATAEVGVVLPVPDDYEAYRQEMHRRAATQLLDRGRRAADSRNWLAADEAYERARRYARAEQQAVLDTAQAQAALQWGQAEAARGHFRTAHTQAGRVLDLLGPASSMGKRAQHLQKDAVARGTRTVAFVPLARGTEAPDLVQRDLHDVLRYEYWSTPPLFLATVDPVATRRLLRRRELLDTRLSRQQARRLGRTLEADLVVVPALVSFERATDDVETETRRASLRRARGRTGSAEGSARDTSYVVETYDLKLNAEVEVRLIDAHTGRRFDHFDAETSVSQSMKRGRFDGNPSRLDLGDKERRLFDADAHRQAERELQTVLVDDLAARVAERTYDRLLQHIP